MCVSFLTALFPHFAMALLIMEILIFGQMSILLTPIFEDSNLILLLKSTQNMVFILVKKEKSYIDK